MKQRGKILFLVLALAFILISLSNFSQAGTLKVTEEHPFLINGTWIPASDLKVGDELTTIDGKKVRITSIQDVETKEPFPVYNLEAGKYSNFVVDGGDGVGVVVHNSNSNVVSPIEFEKVYANIAKKAMNGEIPWPIKNENQLVYLFENTPYGKVRMRLGSVPSDKGLIHQIFRHVDPQEVGIYLRIRGWPETGIPSKAGGLFIEVIEGKAVLMKPYDVAKKIKGSLLDQSLKPLAKESPESILIKDPSREIIVILGKRFSGVQKIFVTAFPNYVNKVPTNWETTGLSKAVYTDKIMNGWFRTEQITIQGETRIQIIPLPNPRPSYQ